MKVLVTGMNGTVAPVLAQTLNQRGHHTLGWNRDLVQPEDTEAVEKFLRDEAPDVIAHLATGPPEWAELLATIAKRMNARFLFTGSVSVFGDRQVGPFSPEDTPIPESDYGRYKLDCEHRIRRGNPDALIARIGWQIGSSRGGNHMVNFLLNTIDEHGVISASRNWYQACSFLTDTSIVLADLIEDGATGLFHLNSNHGMNFFEIVDGLRSYLGASWSIDSTHDPVINNLLSDDRVRIRTLNDVFADD